MSSIQRRHEGIKNLLESGKPIALMDIEAIMMNQKHWTLKEVENSIRSLFNDAVVLKSEEDGLTYYRLHPSYVPRSTLAERTMKERGLSITALCNATGLAHKEFNNAKHGKAPKHAKTIAAYLGIPVEQSFGTHYANIGAPPYNPTPYSGYVKISDKAS